MTPVSLRQSCVVDLHPAALICPPSCVTADLSMCMNFCIFCRLHLVSPYLIYMFCLSTVLYVHWSSAVMHADEDKWVFFLAFMFYELMFDWPKFFNSRIPMSELSNLHFIHFIPVSFWGFFPSIAILWLHSLHPSEDGISSLYSMLTKIKMLCWDQYDLQQLLELEGHVTRHNTSCYWPSLDLVLLWHCQHSC